MRSHAVGDRGLNTSSSPILILDDVVDESLSRKSGQRMRLLDDPSPDSDEQFRTEPKTQRELPIRNGERNAGSSLRNLLPKAYQESTKLSTPSRIPSSSNPPPSNREISENSDGLKLKLQKGHTDLTDAADSEDAQESEHRNDLDGQDQGISDKASGMRENGTIEHPSSNKPRPLHLKLAIEAQHSGASPPKRGNLSKHGGNKQGTPSFSNRHDQVNQKTSYSGPELEETRNYKRRRLDPDTFEIESTTAGSDTGGQAGERSEKDMASSSRSISKRPTSIEDGAEGESVAGSPKKGMESSEGRGLRDELTLSEAQRIIEKYRHEYEKQHSAYVQDLLSREQQKTTSRDSISKWMHSISPFTHIAPLGSNVQKKETHANVHQSVIAGHKNKERTSRVSVTHFSSRSIEVMPYTGSIYPKSNFMAENSKQLFTWPSWDGPDCRENVNETEFTKELEEFYAPYIPTNRMGVVQARTRARSLRSMIESILEEARCPIEVLVKMLYKRKGDLTLKWHNILKKLPDIDIGIRFRAETLCAAFKQIFDFDLVVVAQELYRFRLLEQKPQEQLRKRKLLKFYRRYGCAVCHAHNCRLHGAFFRDLQDSEVPTDDSEDSDDSITYVSDEDDPTTFNYYASVRRRRRAAKMPQVSKQMWNQEGHACSPECFRHTGESDEMIQPPLSRREAEDINILLSAYGKLSDAPCIIALALDMPCRDTWSLLCNHVTAIAMAIDEEAIANGLLPPLEIAPLPHSRPKFKSFLKDQTKPFHPCSHEGSCETAACRCFKLSIRCEKYCACTEDCRRRFRGCICRRTRGACWRNDKCECYMLRRECDPDLCGECGARKVLDPAEQGNIRLQNFACKNVAIQLNQPKRTLLGQSEVSGFGLYIGEHAKADDYIGEYKGEIISTEEADRRGTIYSRRKREYLFRINRIQEIDATNAGSKMRFLNNAQKPENINVEPKSLLCNGVMRMGLFAKKALKAGDELFFNYSYPDENLQGFLEKEQRNGVTTLVPVKTAKSAKNVKSAKRSRRSEVLSGVMTDPALSIEDLESESPATGDAYGDDKDEDDRSTHANEDSERNDMDDVLHLTGPSDSEDEDYEE